MNVWRLAFIFQYFSSPYKENNEMKMCMSKFLLILSILLSLWTLIWNTCVFSVLKQSRTDPVKANQPAQLQKLSEILKFCMIGKRSDKWAVLLWSEISLKVICEKVKFSICDFCNNFVTFNKHTYLFKNIRNDIQTKGKGEINMAKYTCNYSKIV